jgi:hypothetical protein
LEKNIKPNEIESKSKISRTLYIYQIIYFYFLINVESIPVLNRINIVNDIFSFSRAGYINITKQFELYQYLKNENNYIIWKIVLNNFKFLCNIFHSTDVFQIYKSYLLNIIWSNSSSYKTENINENLKRSLMETVVSDDYEYNITNESLAEMTTSENIIEK